jgi:hypothetical protein
VVLFLAGGERTEDGWLVFGRPMTRANRTHVVAALGTGIPDVVADDAVSLAALADEMAERATEIVAEKAGQGRYPPLGWVD